MLSWPIDRPFHIPWFWMFVWFRPCLPFKGGWINSVSQRLFIFIFSLILTYIIPIPDKILLQNLRPTLPDIFSNFNDFDLDFCLILLTTIDSKYLSWKTQSRIFGFKIITFFWFIKFILLTFRLLYRKKEGSLKTSQH